MPFLLPLMTCEPSSLNSTWFRVQGFKVEGLWFRVEGLWFRVECLWFRDEGVWFRVQGLWFRD